MQVGRWPFWVGELVVIAGLLASVAFGQSLVPPAGTQFFPLPLAIVVGVLFLLTAVATGSPAGLEVRRTLFWVGFLVLVGSYILATVYGPEPPPPFGVGWDFVPIPILVGLGLLLASPLAAGSSNTGPTGSNRDSGVDGG